MLQKSFYRQDTLSVAKELLGCTLVHKTKKGMLKGKIVETEAYLCDDPACHAYRKKTQRNAAMFEEGGIAYVYFTYGMHYCFNVVAGKKDTGEAVLIRAIEPIKGIEIMKKNRKKENVKDLCTGPAKLVQAFKLKNVNNHSLISKELYILPRKDVPKMKVTKRVGITHGKEFDYRFYIKDSSYISKL